MDAGGERRRWRNAALRGEADADLLAERLVAALLSKGLRLSTAESCTAGMIASLIADVPGASAVLQGGAVTYTDAIKRRVLGVGERTLEMHSAVSLECACELAEGSKRVFDSDVAVSATGYAGPGGGTIADPVGTVYIGCASALGCQAWRLDLSGTRAEVRRMAASAALGIALDCVESL